MRASSSPDPDVGPASMTLEEAEQTLCVKRGADFETVVRAKNKQLGKAGVDDAKKFAVCICRDPIQTGEKDALEKMLNYRLPASKVFMNTHTLNVLFTVLLPALGEAQLSVDVWARARAGLVTYLVAIE